MTKLKTQLKASMLGLKLEVTWLVGGLTPPGCTRESNQHVNNVTRIKNDKSDRQIQIVSTSTDSVQ